MKISDLRIGQRLTLGFIVIVALTALLGIMGIRYMNQLARQTEYLYQNNIRINNSIRDIKLNIFRVESYVETIGQSNVKQVLFNIENLNKQIDADFLDIAELINEDQQILQTDTVFNEKQIEEAYSAYTDWKVSLRLIINRRQQNDSTDLDSIYERHVDQQFIRLNNRLLSFSQVIERMSNQRYQQSIALWKRSNIYMIIALLSAIILSVLIAWTFTRSITRPLQKIISGIKSIARGKLDEELLVRRGDEVGQLADAFKEMQTNLIAQAQRAKEHDERQNWIKTGQNQLYEAMRGDQSDAELADHVITFVAEYLKAQIAVLYLYYEKTRHLKRVAAYSLSIKEQGENYIKRGEGLVGQSVIEQEIIVVSDLEEDYFSSSSSLATIAPRHIVIAPFVYREKTIGVIELGTFEPLSIRSMQFLTSILEPIAISFNTYIIRSRSRRRKN